MAPHPPASGGPFPRAFVARPAAPFRAWLEVDVAALTRKAGRYGPWPHMLAPRPIELLVVRGLDQAGAGPQWLLFGPAGRPCRHLDLLKVCTDPVQPAGTCGDVAIVDTSAGFPVFAPAEPVTHGNN
ncbi:MAG: hypothetical protein EPO06_11685 [Burkholderiaceae bacterium]|nr:MAG: hypothetical protein EPO06_11685 [Burkholderiaceae bacterium]